MRTRSIVGVITALTLVGVVGVIVLINNLAGTIKLPQLGPECTVSAEGEVTLDSAQMANAATIAAVGVRRGMPEQAVVVALATAFQESELENLDGGDRDSVGLFQQRPSQGWGTVEQIMDPRYSAGKFYTALKKVKGWEKMRVTDAAQRVQRSAYPNAYEKWADESRVLAAALTGRATGAVECVVPDTPAIRGAEAATALLSSLQLDWGRKLGGQARSAETAGLTVAVADPSVGWRFAHWLVSHASGTGLERVRFGDLEWRAPEGKWQPVTDGSAGDQAQVVAEVFH
ncbi:hypothetical protein FHR83_007852 [Actinoplanes campanulatus]|uniref:Uncharacterized protein n=1 Tax=Actinoplanes campanulatus TaxID=113559 RepID=A0A7W5AQ39_9ACTN|nr:hypothetical protein [Actinoplanes campanulatus]GGN28410.1 hypothetical protein GCM10010109_46670 [Actinoplanes campanulatus]GID39056.1 hypothetical protein Aca09nite_55620 [Actinoplanes campanulatus]